MLKNIGEKHRVITGELNQDEYCKLFGNSDLILMPYDPKVYGARGSGVMTDSRRLAIPVVAPRACGFAEGAIAAGSCEPIGYYNVDEIAAAIDRAVDRLERLKSAAKKHRLPAAQAELVEPLKIILGRPRIISSTSSAAYSPDAAKKMMRTVAIEETIGQLRANIWPLDKAIARLWTKTPGPRKAIRLYRERKDRLSKPRN
jgi:hypothetical protein